MVELLKACRPVGVSLLYRTHEMRETEKTRANVCKHVALRRPLQRCTISIN